MANTNTIKILGPALICAIFALPISGCGHAAGMPSETIGALPDEPGDEPVQNGTESITPAVAEPEPVVTQSVQDKILAKYDYVDPTHAVPDDLLSKAIVYYDTNLSKISNPNYLSVINFAARSTTPRFFIIDMKTGKVWSIHVAHGRDSDPDHDGYATSFSNQSGSNKSSLGFYRAAETYNGKHGLSVRLDGLSSTNSNARSRAIVLHGASYVEESSALQGRSLGCPAVSMGNRDRVVAELKGGSIIYAGLAGK